MDLRAAKEYVERIAAGQPTSGTPPSFVAGDLDDELRALVARGQTIEAIRRVRDTTGMGLKDAKDYVDQLRSRDQQPG
jgi:ribosomal protein L7/L12